MIVPFDWDMEIFANDLGYHLQREFSALSFNKNIQFKFSNRFNRRYFSPT